MGKGEVGGGGGGVLSGLPLFYVGLLPKEEDKITIRHITIWCSTHSIGMCLGEQGKPDKKEGKSRSYILKDSVLLFVQDIVA